MRPAASLGILSLLLLAGCTATPPPEPMAHIPPLPESWFAAGDGQGNDGGFTFTWDLRPAAFVAPDFRPVEGAVLTETRSGEEPAVEFLDACGLRRWSVQDRDGLGRPTEVVFSGAGLLFPALLVAGREPTGEATLADGAAATWRLAGDAVHVEIASTKGTHSWTLRYGGAGASGLAQQAGAESFTLHEDTGSGSRPVPASCGAPPGPPDGLWERDGIDAGLPAPYDARGAFLAATALPLPLTTLYQESHPDWFVQDALYYRAGWLGRSELWFFVVAAPGATDGIALRCPIVAGRMACEEAPMAFADAVPDPGLGRPVWNVRSFAEFGARVAGAAPCSLQFSPGRLMPVTAELACDGDTASLDPFEGRLVTVSGRAAMDALGLGG